MIKLFYTCLLLLSVIGTCSDTNKDFQRLIDLETYVQNNHKLSIQAKYDRILIATPVNCPAVVDALQYYISMKKVKDRTLIISTGMDSMYFTNYTLNPLILEDDNSLMKDKSGFYMPTLISIDSNSVQYSLINIQNLDSVLHVVGWK